MSRLSKGYLIAVVGILFWSTTGVFIGYLITNYQIPPLLLAFWRDLLVCAALVTTLFLLRRPLLRISFPQLRFHIGYGLVLAIFNSIYVISVENNGAAVATVLAYTSAGFTAVLALWLFKEQLGLFKALAVIMSLGGCVLVSNAYDPQMWKLNPVAVSTGLLSGLLFAGYSLFGKEAAKRSINPWTSMLYSFAFAAFFLMLLNLVLAWRGAAGSVLALVPHLPATGWLMLGFLSFIPTLVGFGLYNTAMHYLPASIANLLATAEPALTAVEAYLFLGERMTLAQIVGSSIILLGILVVQLEKEDQGIPLQVYSQAAPPFTRTE